MATRIIIDSTVDVLPAEREKFHVVPLAIQFGDESYLDGVDITHKEFYEKLVENTELPKTSQPSPDAFAAEYRKGKEAGDDMVVLTVSSRLSGTYQSACIAAMDYDKGIYIVDSLSAAIGTGILAQYALRLLEQGMHAAEIARELEEVKEKVTLIAMVDTLEYLKKGGRVSKTVAFAGELLSIKPVIAIKEGAVAILGKARGSKQGNNLLVREIQNAGGVDFTMPVLLGYTGLSDALLQKYITDSAALWQESSGQLKYTVVGSGIGTHVGPGAVAVAFFKK